MKRIIIVIGLLIIGIVLASIQLPSNIAEAITTSLAQPVTSGSSTAVPIDVAQAATATPIPTTSAALRTTYTVQRGTVSEEYLFRARWLPRDQVQLAFEVNGSVRSVNVQRGDTVSTGSVLADLQIDDLEATLQSQLLNLSSAQRRLNEGSTTSSDSVTSAQFNLAGENLSLESQQLSLPWTSVNNAWASVESAQRALENAQRDYDDALSYPDTPASEVNRLRESLISAQDSLARAQNDYYNASASYRQAELNLSQQENRVLQAEMALEEASVSGGDPDLVDAVFEAQLNVDRTREEITKSTLTAPFDGVVLEVTIQPGDSVQAFVGVITLALPQPLEAIASISFNDTQLLQVGQVGTCEEANRTETRVQCVIRQLPVSNRDVDQTVRVAAALADTISGALVDVTMILSESVNTLWLPPEALNIFNNRTFVVLQTPEGERVQDVTIGLETDDRVEILSGVNEGDIVVQQ